MDTPFLNVYLVILSMDIRKYCVYLGDGKIPFTDFFIERKIAVNEFFMESTYCGYLIEGKITHIDFSTLRFSIACKERNRLTFSL